jgi:hypothetical protein
MNELARIVPLIRPRGVHLRLGEHNLELEAA